MAEIRKHNPEDADGLGKLVRDALGDRVRPHQPGPAPKIADEVEDADAEKDMSAASLPSWTGDGNGFTF